MGDDHRSRWLGKGRLGNYLDVGREWVRPSFGRRGLFEEVEGLHDHAIARGVKLWTPPRLSNLQLTGLMRRSVAIVSMAHGEPFGLTPIEAFAVGTPASICRRRGLQDTIEDGVNGRLLPRDDPMAWQEALNEAQDADLKKKWAEAGRQKIAELDLSPDSHARRIFDVYKQLNNS